jgi:hypothetical protein
VNWDDEPQVEAVVGRTLEELLTVRPRRQRLDGFDSVYSDIVDYIVRCTYNIWDRKDIGLIRTHYSADCPVFSLAGKIVGAEAMVHGTLEALAAFPDRSPIAEEVIWSEDSPGLFVSSHRIMSSATHLGLDSMLRLPGRGSSGAVPVIADCVCRENRIIQEWLARDYAQLALQCGVQPRAVAQRLAETDMQGDQARHRWMHEEKQRILSLEGSEPPENHPAAAIVHALRSALSDDRYGTAAETTSSTIEVRWPAGRQLVGRGAWVGCLIQLRTALDTPRFVADHWAARPRPDGDVDVALRWWLTGRHVTDGVWGVPMGNEILVLAISHYRVRCGRILEDFTVFDEVGVMRQAFGGLGACQQ